MISVPYLPRNMFGVCLSTLKFYLSAMSWGTVQEPSTLHTHVLVSWQHYGNFSDNWKGIKANS